jgi:hypothetical protein
MTIEMHVHAFQLLSMDVAIYDLVWEDLRHLLLPLLLSPLWLAVEAAMLFQQKTLAEEEVVVVVEEVYQLERPLEKFERNVKKNTNYDLK